MEDLMQVVKEANKDIANITAKFKNDKDVFAHYQPFHERVKDQVADFNFFLTICLQDVKYNFIGGGIAQEGEALTVSLNPQDQYKELMKAAFSDAANVDVVKNSFKVRFKKDCPADELERLEDVKNLLPFWPKPRADYNGFGLRYDIDELNNPALFGSLMMMPVETMAEFADHVTKTEIDKDNKEFIMDNMLNSGIAGQQHNFAEWNVTAIGNTAYVALHCKNENARAVAIKDLEDCHAWVMQKLEKELENL